MTNIYPTDFVHAKICYNCYSLREHFCVKRDTGPTNASIHRFGCDAYFDPIDKNGSHNCLNCKFIRRKWCLTHKKQIDNDKDFCTDFRVRPYFKEHPLGLSIITSKERKAAET